ncbi:MAG: hypothetical protein LIO86_02340 [Lachnospiraceae bacterium]|nr:hypothetical protein [Lachnospiraceae bacterium]
MAERSGCHKAAHHPQDLEDDITVLYAKDERNALRERRADVSKRYADGYSFCIYCLENESKISYDMPVRNMEFEAARYREQVRRISAEHEKADYQNWDEYSSKFTKNDRLNLINMYELEHIESCRSQLKYALRLLQKDQNREAIYQEVQENPAYRELDQETGKMMAILLRDEKLEQYIEEQQEDERKETFNMCKALDDMRQEAMERGEGKGEDRFARLTNFLLTDERLEDLRHAIDNQATRQKLYREYHILN